MATISTDSSFITYNLTEDEALIGAVLTGLQRQVIQNRISAYAEEKLNLNYTPNDHQTFLQKEAELQGKLSVLRDLLDQSNSAEQFLMSRSVAQSQS